MSKKAIVCIDDCATILTSIKSQLKANFGNSFTYEFAESAEEGLEIIDELANDNVNILVIVSDWLMPGMKGDEFLIEVHKKHPDIIKILLTGQADKEAVERAVKFANLHKFLNKPWNENELIDAINSGLQKFK